MVTAVIKLKRPTPWKKSYDQPRLHIQKQRHDFTNKVLLVKAMVFPVVMHGCKGWTVKKAEHGRIDAFELWCWRRLENHLNCKEIKPVNPKEISPEYSLERWMLKLKF